MSLPRTMLSVALGASAVAAGATVTVTPGAVTVFAGEATPRLTVQLAFDPPQVNAGSGSLEIVAPPALSGHLAVDPDPATYPWSPGAITATTQLRLLTAPTAPAGIWTVLVRDETLGAGQTTVQLEIRSSTFAGAVAPQPARLVQGGPPVALRVRTLPGPGFGLPVRWAVEGLPAFLHAGPAVLSGPPTYAEREIELSLGDRARPGTYTGRLRGTAGDLAPVDLPLSVVVAAADFTPRLSPAQVELVPGGPPVRVTVRTRAPGLVSGAVAYRAAALPPGVIATAPPASAGPAFPPVELLLSATETAAPGSAEARVVGTYRPGAVVREAALHVVVRRPGPRITGVVPTRLAAGALGQRVAVLGAGFAPGALVAAGSPAVRVVSSRVVSEGRIELLLDVRADAAPATVELAVSNPDGEAAPQPGVVTILDGDSLAAPLAVRTVAVLFPLAGSQLGLEEAVRPRGVLAAAGSGPVIVSWTLDGVPFERAVVQARGGEPVAVEAQQPIPRAALGGHELRLVVEGPQQLASEPVPLVQVVARSSALRPLAPEDGVSVAPGEAPRLSWTLVPGAVGYVVELLDADGVVVASWSTAEAVFEPPAGDLDALEPGLYGWQVRPRFTAGVPGEPGPTRSLHLGRLPPPQGASGRLPPGRFRLAGLPPRGPGLSAADRTAADRPGVDRLAAGRFAVGHPAPSGTFAVPAGSGGWMPRAAGHAGGGVGVDGDGVDGGGEWEEEGGLAGAEGGTSEGFAADPGAGGGGWTLGIEGILSGVEADGAETETSATLAASGAGESLLGSGTHLKATAELSLSEALSGEVPDSENRTWALTTTRPLGPTHASLSAGYGGAELLTGAQLASPGLTTGGARLGVRAGALDITAYTTFDSELQGVVSALEGPEVELSAAALEVGRDRPFRLGLVALEADRAGDAFTPAGEGSLLSLLAGWSAHAISITFEAAHSETDPQPLEGLAGESGDALRLGLAARAGAWSFDLGLRSIDPDFEHPASPGLSLGGVSDRVGGELRLGRGWQRGNFNLGLSRLESGAEEASDGPQAERSAVDLSLSQGLSQRVSVTLAANLASTDAEAAPDLFLPAGELEDWRVALGVQERAGAWSLGQQISLAGSDDALDPTRFSETGQVGLDLSRAGPVFSLWGQLGAVRTRSGLERQETTQWLASLQPSWRLERLGLDLQPYLSWSRSSDDLVAGDLTSESYRLAVGWSPGWRDRALTVQAAGDWTRTRGGFFGDGAEGFAGRYTLSLGLRGARALPRPPPSAGPPGG